MTTPSTTPAPTLPPNWTPEATASCLRNTDYWIWDYDDGGNGVGFDARTVIGGPSQTTQCLPESWDADVTYAGTACPSYYSPACPTKGGGAVTCCPWIYSFSCVDENWGPGAHGSMFRCESQFASGGSIQVTKTLLNENQITVQSIKVTTDVHLFALAVMYTSPPPSSPAGPTMTSMPSSGTDSTGLTPSSKANSGISAGAAAGIGIGSAAGVIILALLIWFIYRRRKAAACVSQYQTSVMTHPEMAADPRSPLQGSSQDPSQYSAQYPTQSTWHGELPVVDGRYELDHRSKDATPVSVTGHEARLE
ncbi:hypothetical protein F4861DRAFT_126308 [Xylaria intraflava]|nr:hypothetical protein F4861DRAFT_126308 [Xylaria intraflava]